MPNTQPSKAARFIAREVESMQEDCAPDYGMLTECIDRHMLPERLAAEKMREALVSALDDFKTINESGMWQGHPFTQMPEIIRAALAEWEQAKAGK